jgi:hypothetical protein
MKPDLKPIPIAHTAEAAALSLLAADPELLANLPWDASLFALETHKRFFPRWKGCTSEQAQQTR